MNTRISEKRPWTFYALATLFGAFLLFLYGPMFVIYVLSFQGENGGVTDNRVIIAELVALRAERAKLLGFATFADYLDVLLATTQSVSVALLLIGPSF